MIVRNKGIPQSSEEGMYGLRTRKEAAEISFLKISVNRRFKHIKEEDVKKLIVFCVILFFFSISGYAQTGMMESRQGQTGGMRPPANCPKMQQMSEQGMMQSGQQGCPMMGQDIMQMMMDMMNMQEKMMKGIKAEEKKKMMKDVTRMRGKMRNMMAMCGMTGGMAGKASDVYQCRMNCAEQWLKKAIDLHEVHIKNPKTATEASQMEMMEQMKKAYDCLTGAGSGMCGSQSKETP